LSHPTSPFFFSQDRVLRTIFPGLDLNHDLPGLCFLSS
jgi:hypothetical protein